MHGLGAPRLLALFFLGFDSLWAKVHSSTLSLNELGLHSNQALIAHLRHNLVVLEAFSSFVKYSFVARVRFHLCFVA